MLSQRQEKEEGFLNEGQTSENEISVGTSFLVRKIEEIL